MEKNKKVSIIIAVLLIFAVIFSVMLLGNKNNSESDVKEQEVTQEIQEQTQELQDETQEFQEATQEFQEQTQDVQQEPEVLPEPEQSEEEPEQSTEKPEQNIAEQKENGITFPIQLEGGKLEVESLFQFSGINPDAEKQEATDVAAIVLKNVSGEYLKTAEVQAVLADGTAYTFFVQDLPAGKAVTAFTADNGVLPAEAVCKSLTADAEFGSAKSAAGVEVSVDGMTMILENVSGKDLYGVDVYYRDVFNDKYFGGITYKSTIEKMTAGETVMLTAVDTTIGMIEIVQVIIKE